MPEVLCGLEDIPTRISMGLRVGGRREMFLITVRSFSQLAQKVRGARHPNSSLDFSTTPAEKSNSTSTALASLSGAIRFAASIKYD